MEEKEEEVKEAKEEVREVLVVMVHLSGSSILFMLSASQARIRFSVSILSSSGCVKMHIS